MKAYCRFTEEYRQRILCEADVLRKTRQVHELLAREGLSYQHLDYWRKHRPKAVCNEPKAVCNEPKAPGVPKTAVPEPATAQRLVADGAAPVKSRESGADPDVLDDYIEVSDGVSRLRQDLKEAEDLKMRLEALISGEEEWAESLQRQEEQA